MDDGAVLNVGPFAYDYLAGVAPEDAAEPDAGVGMNLNVADEYGVWCDEGGLMDFGGEAVDGVEQVVPLSRWFTVEEWEHGRKGAGQLSIAVAPVVVEVMCYSGVEQGWWVIMDSNHYRDSLKRDKSCP